MANNATLKNGLLVTAGYSEVYKRGCDAPGEYAVRTCQPASGPGFEFGRGIVTVTQADIDEAQRVGHKTLPVH